METPVNQPIAATTVLLPDAQSVSDDELGVLGMRLWPHTFAKTTDILQARHLLFGSLIRAGMPLPYVATASIAGLTAAQWAHYGYPSLVAGHKFAAALMSTRAHVDSLDDLHIPWLAFRCVVPDGLLHINGQPIDRIMISRRVAPQSTATMITGHEVPRDAPEVAWVMELYPNSNDAARVHVYHPSLHGLLTAPSDAEKSLSIDDDGSALIGPDQQDALARVVLLAQRYVLGLLVMLQSHPKFGRATERPMGPRSKRRDGPPTHRTFLLGHAIDVDCRPAVRDYLDGQNHGRRGPPSVQTWITGYYRRQRIGVGRTGCKVIWVLPHWRGPIDAPILVHSYRGGHEPPPREAT
jgi:hypothetical protein